MLRAMSRYATLSGDRLDPKDHRAKLTPAEPTHNAPTISTANVGARPKLAFGITNSPLESRCKVSLAHDGCRAFALASAALRGGTPLMHKVQAQEGYEYSPNITELKANMNDISGAACFLT